MKDWHARPEDCAHALEAAWPSVVQSNVRVRDSFSNAKRGYFRLDGKVLTFILEAECIDNELWLHLSIKPQNRKSLPTWDELRWAKDYFLGDRKAIQVLPPRSEYVNLDPYVLHLYAPIERDPLPDFRGVDSGGRLAI